MDRFVFRLIVTALAVLGASALAPQSVHAENLEAAVLFALVLGLLNAFLRPILLLLTLPLTLLTLGLFTLVVNAVVFWLASLFPLGVAVNGFTGAFVGALVVTAVSFVASRAIK